MRGALGKEYAALLLVLPTSLPFFFLSPSRFRLFFYIFPKSKSLHLSHLPYPTVVSLYVFRPVLSLFGFTVLGITAGFFFFSFSTAIVIVFLSPVLSLSRLFVSH